MKIRGYQIFWIQMVLAVLCMLAGFWVSTLTFVTITGLIYGELGMPWFFLFGFPVYQPFSIVVWVTSFFSLYQDELLLSLIPLALAAVASMFLTAWLTIVRHREDSQVDSYGSSRWSDEDEIKASELVFDESKLKGLAKLRKKDYAKAQDAFKTPLVLGKMEDGTLIRHSGSQHAALIAPSRSEKGVGVIIPTLMSYLESVIVTDIKKENWYATAGFRSKFSHCICFEPTSRDSAHWNPLLEIRKGDFEVKDAQNIANILVDPEGAKDKLDHWETSAYSLFTATILHTLYAEEEKSLSGLAYFLASPKRTLYETLKLMLNTKHVGGEPHPVVASTAREMMNRSENELSSVMSTSMGFLTLYRDPIIADVTSRSDFRVLDLVEAEKPVSLYLVIPPSDIARTRPILRLLLNMTMSKIAEKPLRPGGENKPYKHRLLTVLDEFPALGKMNFFEDSLGFLAGYGVRVLIIAQVLSQLTKKYDSLLDACHITVFYTPNPQDEASAERISKMLGDATNERRNSMFSGGRMNVWLKNVTVSTQEMGRKLLTPGEVLQFSRDHMILLVSGLNPSKIKKIRYYDDPIFKPRMLPEPSLSINPDLELCVTTEWDGLVIAPEVEDDEELEGSGGSLTQDIEFESVSDDKDLVDDEHTIDEPKLDLYEDMEKQETVKQHKERVQEKHEQAQEPKRDEGRSISSEFTW